VSAVLFRVKEMFSFQQGVSGETVRLIADSCQQLKKFNLVGVEGLFDGELIHAIDRLGKQLTTLVFVGTSLTDVVFLYLKNCVR
jgi:hypothetical protein